MGMDLDILAWSILWVFYLLTVVPLIGNRVDGEHKSYAMAWALGAALHISIAAIVGLFLVVVWAVIRVRS